MLFLDVTIFLLLRQPIKNDGLLPHPIACYETGKRTHDFVMTYVGNRMINMICLTLFLIGNIIVWAKFCRPIELIIYFTCGIFIV